jgi:type I restriction enzyme S subunit
MPGDVLLNITGASLGRCCLVLEQTGPANVNQHVCIIRARREIVLPQYLCAAICSRLVQSQVFANENGTSREGLNFQQVADLLIPCPPNLAEQDAVAQSVNARSRGIDGAMGKVRDSIATLREYRTALISAAVTGKIDLRQFECLSTVPEEA